MSGIPVSIIEAPPTEAMTTIIGLSGGVQTWIGKARSSQVPFKASIANGFLTNIAVSTNVGTVTLPAHGLQVGNRITLAGATVDTDLNGNYIVASVIGVDSFTIATSSVGDATYTDAGLYLTTTAPRTNQAIWSIQKLFYSGTSLIRTAYAEGNSGFGNIWDNAATLAYN